MSDVVGSAEFELRATREKMKDDLRQAERDLKGFTDKAERDTNEGARSIGEGIGRMARGAVVALTALVSLLGLAAAGALNLGIQGMRMADQISDTARRIGIGTNALQEWRFVASRAGEDAKAADRALESFATKLAQATAGVSKEASRAFGLIGLGQDDLRRFRSTEDALDAVVDKIGDLKREADRVAVAEALGLGPLADALRDGSDEVARLRDEARELGIVMDAEMIRRASQAQEQFDTLAQVIDIHLKGAFIDLAPAILKAIELVAQLAADLSDAMDQWRALDARTGRGLQSERSRLVAERDAIADIYGARPLDREVVAARAIEGGNYSVVQPSDANRTRGRHGLLPGGHTQLPSAGPSGNSITGGLDFLENRPRTRLVYAGEQFDAAQRRIAEIDAEMARRRELDSPQRQDRDTGSNVIIPPGRTRVDRSAERAAEREARRAERVEQEIYRARARALGIYDRETATVQERFDIEQAQVELEREAQREQLASRRARGDITQAEFDQLSLLQAQTETMEDRVAADVLSRDLADERLAQERMLSDLTAQLISLQSGAARSAAERRRLELELLEITQQQRRDALRRDLERNPNLSAADRETALNRLDSIDKAERSAVERQSMGPLEAWRDRSLQTADEIREAYEDVAARGLDSLNSGLVDAIMNTRSLGEVFSNVARQIIADLAAIAVRQSITEPLANMLFGGGKIQAISTGAKPGGGGFMGFLRGMFGFDEGGYTGDGAKMDPAGVVHKGEYVLKAEAVRRIGIANLDAMNTGVRGYAEGGYVGFASLPTLPHGASMGQGGGQRQGVDVRLHFNSDFDLIATIDGQAQRVARQEAGGMMAQVGAAQADRQRASQYRTRR